MYYHRGSAVGMLYPEKYIAELFGNYPRTLKIFTTEPRFTNSHDVIIIVQIIIKIKYNPVTGVNMNTVNTNLKAEVHLLS